MTHGKVSMKNRFMKYWQLYVFLIIPVIYIIIFAYIPMGGLQIAFKDFTGLKGIWGSDWVGLKHFKTFLNSYQFKRVFMNTIGLSFYQLLAGFPIPIILALGLNSVRSKKFKKLVQTVTYMPHFISVIVLVGIINTLFNPITGLYGTMSELLFGVQPADIFGNPGAFKHLYVWSGIWQNCGWSSIIYIAALSSVDKELHEAAKVDGANRFQRVIHIDFQAIVPTAIILLIMNTGKIMTIGFEKVFLMQNSLNLSSSEIISTYVYKVGLVTGGGDFSYATAIGLFNSIINLILIVSVNKISKKVSNTSLW